MTYSVLMGMLNLTHALTHLLCCCWLSKGLRSSCGASALRITWWLAAETSNRTRSSSNDTSGQVRCHLTLYAPCGLRGCKNGPASFPGRMSYKATKPGLVFFLYLSMFFIIKNMLRYKTKIVLVFIRAPFYVLLVFIVCVVCLLVVLVKLSLLAKLLARKTPLSSESSPLQFLALA